MIIILFVKGNNSCGDKKPSAIAKPLLKLNAAEKPPYGRLRVLTAPPTSVHDIVANIRTTSTIGNNVQKECEEKSNAIALKNIPQENLNNTAVVKRSNIKASTALSQRYGNRDNSVTQFAVIDDENISALQQVSITILLNLKIIFFLGSNIIANI